MTAKDEPNEYLYDVALFEQALAGCTPPDDRKEWITMLRNLTAFALFVGVDPREAGLRWSSQWSGWDKSQRRDRTQIKGACSPTQDFRGQQAACAEAFINFSGIQRPTVKGRKKEATPAQIAKRAADKKRRDDAKAKALKAEQRRAKAQISQLDKLLTGCNLALTDSGYWNQKQRACLDPLPVPEQWRMNKGLWRAFPVKQSSEAFEKRGVWWSNNIVIPVYELTSRRMLRPVGAQVICGSASDRFQYIESNKFFPAGTPLHGNFHSFPGCGAALDKGAPLILVEGAITGLAVASCTDFLAPVACCFSVSTMLSVAATFRRHYPDLEVVLLPDTGGAYELSMKLVHGDAEKGTPSQLGGASVVDLSPMLPDMRDNGDFFDIYARHGRENSRAHLRELVRVARRHKSPFMTAKK